MDRSVDFFSRVLTFEKVSDVEVGGRGLRAPARGLRPADAGRPDEARGRTDRARRVPGAARATDPRRRSQQRPVLPARGDHRERHGEGLPGPSGAQGPARLHAVRNVSPTGTRTPEGIEAFYFKDPDGHALEILHFPPDKGAPKWKRPHGPTVPGHRPHRHRRRRHGCEPAVLPRHPRPDGGRGRRELRDRAGAPEQRLRSAASDHGPASGRRAGDRAARVPGAAGRTPLPARSAGPTTWPIWQTTLAATDVVAAAQELFAARVLFVSPGEVSLPDASLGFAKGLLIRDPDGHAMRVVQH